eukprot:TRINITY_DN5902_c0_g4_i2.p1 TRINITY_DN5902_c0_g4~~TRINITY_DN5902_c0_g4_i2.p1  ORF type:complete len:853 (-),score=54.79 TRINITY_DN5902_c0_g4_i2:942-3500(-)
MGLSPATAVPIHVRRPVVPKLPGNTLPAHRAERTLVVAAESAAQTPTRTKPSTATATPTTTATALVAHNSAPFPHKDNREHVVHVQAVHARAAPRTVAETTFLIIRIAKFDSSCVINKRLVRKRPHFPCGQPFSRLSRPQRRMFFNSTKLGAFLCALFLLIGLIGANQLIVSNVASKYTGITSPIVIHGWYITSRSPTGACYCPTGSTTSFCGWSTYFLTGSQYEVSVYRESDSCSPPSESGASDADWGKLCATNGDVLACSGVDANDSTSGKVILYRTRDKFADTFSATISINRPGSLITALEVGENGLVAIFTHDEFSLFGREGNSWVEPFNFETPRGARFGAFATGSKGLAFAATYIQEGSTPSIWTFVNDTIVSKSFIEQSSIPGWTSSSTFGSLMAIGGYSDDWLAVSANSNTVVLIFMRYSHSWMYHSTVTVGPGLDRIALGFVGSSAVLAFSSTDCQMSGGPDCIKLLTNSGSPTWFPAAEFAKPAKERGSSPLTYFTLKPFSGIMRLYGFYENGELFRWALEEGTVQVGAPSAFTVMQNNLLSIEMTAALPRYASDWVEIGGMLVQYRLQNSSTWTRIPTKLLELSDSSIILTGLSCMSPNLTYVFRASYFTLYGQQGPWGPEQSVTVPNDVPTAAAATYSGCWTNRNCYNFNCAPWSVDCSLSYSDVSPFVLTSSPVTIPFGGRHVAGPVTCNLMGSTRFCCDYVAVTSSTYTYKSNQTACANVGEEISMLYYDGSDYRVDYSSYSEKWYLRVSVTNTDTIRTISNTCGMEFAETVAELVPSSHSSAGAGTSGTAPGVIAGIVVGCVVAAAIIGGGVWYFIRRPKSNLGGSNQTTDYRLMGNQ